MLFLQVPSLLVFNILPCVENSVETTVLICIFGKMAYCRGNDTNQPTTRSKQIMKFAVTYTETSKVTRIVEAKTKEEAMDKMQQLIDTHDIDG